MITISEIVQQLIRQSPFISESLAEGLINISSLARKFQPEIENTLGKPIKQGAIVMAINRIQFGDLTVAEKSLRRFFQRISDYSVRSNLVSYTFANSDTLPQCQLNLLNIISQTPKIFYTFSQGVSETTIIVTDAMEEAIESLFKHEKLIAKDENLASITLLLPEDNRAMYGIYYYILKDLAWNGINLVEIISTSNEFTLIVRNTDLDQTFSILMKLKRTV